MTKARDLANASTALSAVSATELGYLDGVTSAVQTQVDAKLASSTAATTYVANALADAKGDIFVASADNTVTRLPVGSTGDTIVADASTATGLRYQGSQAAGKNLLINGAFDNWQRGTSFTTSAVYCADRWFTTIDSPTAGTISQQTTSLPTGFRYSIRCQRTAGNTGTAAFGISQPLDTATSIPAQGNTVVFSYWAKAGANYSNGSNVLNIRINSGTGTDQGPVAQFGGWTGYAETAPNQAITTTWTRYTATYNVPSNATQLGIRFFMIGSGTAGANDWFEVTGVQLEIGSVATTFTRAGGTIQGELAACQRYYVRFDGASYAVSGYGTFTSTTNAVIMTPLPSTMRIAPSAVDWGTLSVFEYSAAFTPSAVTMDTSYTNPKVAAVNATVSGATAGRSAFFRTSGSTAGFIGYSAEL